MVTGRVEQRGANQEQRAIRSCQVPQGTVTSSTKEYRDRVPMCHQAVTPFL